MSYWIDEYGEIHREGGRRTPPPPPPPPNSGFDLGVAVSIISLIASNIFLLIYIIGLMSGWDRGTFLKWASCICIGLYLLRRLVGLLDKDDMPLFFKLFAGIISVIIYCGCPDMFGWWDVGEVFSWVIGLLVAFLLVDAFVKE